MSTGFFFCDFTFEGFAENLLNMLKSWAFRVFPFIGQREADVKQIYLNNAHYKQPLHFLTKTNDGGEREREREREKRRNTSQYLSCRIAMIMKLYVNSLYEFIITARNISDLIG